MKIKSSKEYEEALELAKSMQEAYYYDEAMASDAEYDALIRALRDWEKGLEEAPWSMDKIVAPTPKGKKRAHKKPMYSMQDLFNEAELGSWLSRASLEDELFYLEPKFDGASMSLYYENGELVWAASRGDGRIGEDISLAAGVIGSIPKRIDYKGAIEIRGELLMLKEDFQRLNEERLLKGQMAFANPRNAASGTMRLLDLEEISKRELRFYPYDLGFCEKDFHRHSEKIGFVRGMGFLEQGFWRLVKASEIEAVYLELLGLRDGLPMQLDGLVLRLDDLGCCEKLGYTDKFPRFMAAFKFPAQEVSSQLLSLRLQVGRTGRVTPVANIEPVDICGALVSSVTLHNFDEIRRMDLRLNDFVGVTRSGDVIPKITAVYKARRSGEEEVIKAPSYCPVCESLLLVEGALLMCQNLGCEARLKGALKHFASRGAMDIQGLAIKTIEQLHDRGILRTPLDLYRLKAEDLQGLEGFGEKKIANLLQAISKSKKANLSAFIVALGILHIGKVAAVELSKAFGKDWHKEQDYEKLEGFGPQMAWSLRNFLGANLGLVERFYEELELKEDLELASSSAFSGKSFVITGTLSQSREHFEEKIKAAGGKISSLVSKKTDYLLYGQKAGSKLDRAKELGITMLNEGEFLAILENQTESM